MTKKYGLVRVSTKEQNEARQIKAMKKAGVPQKNIFIEKVSGKDFDRAEYNKLKKVLKEGDTLFIESIDRLGRNYDGILREWNLFKNRKIKIMLLSNPAFNFLHDPKLIFRFLRDIIILILAFQAEQEYINIKERQAQGIEVAKQTGKKLGRPKKKITKRQRTIITDFQNGIISKEQAMAKLKLKKSAFHNLLNTIKEGEKK